jgi:hypothetical protein
LQYSAHGIFREIVLRILTGKGFSVERVDGLGRALIVLMVLNATFVVVNGPARRLVAGTGE